MSPRPVAVDERHVGSGKLRDKVALITGGDSGIGRAVAVAFAREGARVAICYHTHDEDAEETLGLVFAEHGEAAKAGATAIAIKGDLKDEAFSQQAVERCVRELGALDVLVNHAGVQTVQESIQGISAEQLRQTFEVNVFAPFFLTKAALKHMRSGGAIINTSSVNAFKGHASLLDYSASKAAVHNLTYSLSQSPEVLSKSIRVNAVAPGPIWTPLIPATFPGEKQETFGSQVPFKRCGQPEECASCYVFLASNVDSSYIAGQTLHPNGGVVVHG